MSVNLNEYKDFVEKVTSEPSLDAEALSARLRELNQKIDIAGLLTGSTGLFSEGGEFAEIVKKCVFQGKPMNDETVFHMKRELGDILWYWVTACRALDLDPEDVIKENVKKLSARYPSGEFSIFDSENRKEGDL